MRGVEKWFKCLGDVLVLGLKLDRAREEVCILSFFVGGGMCL